MTQVQILEKLSETMKHAALLIDVALETGTENALFGGFCASGRSIGRVVALIEMARHAGDKDYSRFKQEEDEWEEQIGVPENALIMVIDRTRDACESLEHTIKALAKQAPQQIIAPPKVAENFDVKMLVRKGH